ncbi:MAG: NAD-binding protein, partial [Gemmatimonadetes bacterium]|nr:NAD(P)-dependent oxidoreductase [Gemmatimonadota bacterium]NIQ59009.1 NAD(P)-dependent oxidoreductase [Gemmatimonadota bacterium]NIU79216.1 NAD-binding protein [Gammaproteobacteria bacterium]NIX47897.1 NAD-binding protein [Gemmatimonadota bacterium]NIY12268.1 NAD-binding protein [Gemmatimonadota bacterium]
MRIAFLGLGSMGRPMARNLARSDHELVVWNRTPEAAESVDGAALAPTPAQAADGAEMAITMLSDDAAVEAVVLGEDGLVHGLADGAVHASMSTISAALSRRLAREHAARTQRYVAAPVFGRPEAAERAALRLVVAGDRDAIDACLPAFDLLGQGVIEAGTKPEGANVFKLAGNFMLASAIEAMAEAYALVRTHGIDTGLFHETLASGLFRSPIYEAYGGMIEAHRYEPAGFALQHGLKDVRYALAAGEERNLPMPLASLLRDRLLSA